MDKQIKLERLISSNESLIQIIESQKQTFDALLKKYNQLNSTFEELLVDKIVLSELRDFWRNKATTLK